MDVDVALYLTEDLVPSSEIRHGPRASISSEVIKRVQHHEQIMHSMHAAQIKDPRQNLVTLLERGAFSRVFEYLVHCLFNRSFDVADRSTTLTDRIDHADAVALWNYASRKTDLMMTRSHLPAQFKRQIKRNSICAGFIQVDLDDASTVPKHVLKFSVPCAKGAWSGGAMADNLYDRVRMPIDFADATYTSDPMLILESVYILHLMATCHCWYMLARYVYANLEAYGFITSDTDLQESGIEGTADNAQVAAAIEALRTAGIEEAALGHFRVIMGYAC